MSGLICDICRKRKKKFRAWRIWIVCDDCRNTPEGQEAIRLHGESMRALGAWVQACGEKAEQLGGR